MLVRRRILGFALLCALCGVCLGCDDSAPPKNPFAPPADAPKKPPPVTEPPTPKGPPELVVDTISPKVGFGRVVLNKPSDRQKLSKAIDEVKDVYSGHEAKLLVDRQAKPEWVIAMIEELARIGASPIVVKTDTREEFTKQLQMFSESQAESPPSCTVVAMILPDRGTAVWKLSGGTAAKRGKGLAGPDLSMTGDTLARYAKGCKQSDWLFVSGSEGIEWGLIYDLAASAKRIEKQPYRRIVLLSQPPIAGRAVHPSR